MAYLAMLACAALLRCMPQAPQLLFSIASWASETPFSASNLTGVSAIASTADSVLERLAPLQPTPMWAAWAGTTAKATAAIAAAPINVLIMRIIHLLFLGRYPRDCGICDTIIRCSRHRSE